MLSQMVVEDVRLAEGQEMSGPAEGWMCVQLRDGLAYRLGGTRADDLPLGGVALLLPGRAAVVRASQLRPCEIRRLTMGVEALSGVLTIEEDTALRCLVEEKFASGWILPAEHPAAMELAGLPVGFGRSPAQRVELLGLWHDLVGPLAGPEDDSAAAVSPTAADRFRRLMGEIPEGELMLSSPEDLARRCRCTVRHLNRLFRQTYGVALRAKLQELLARNGSGRMPRRSLPVR